MPLVLLMLALLSVSACSKDLADGTWSLSFLAGISAGLSRYLCVILG